MAFTAPYQTDTVRIPNQLIPGNETSDSPVEFDIAPAWGPDLARLKSLVVACSGLIQDQDWSPRMQEAVIKGFETGAPAFVNTVTAIRNLAVPMRMALRAGILGSPPKGTTPDSPVPITTGEEFSHVCGALTGTGLLVAMKIVTLSGKNELDPRFFAQPSGSGGVGTRRRTTTTAGSAPRTPRRRGTAGSQQTAGDSQPSGTSPSKPS